MQHGQFYTHQQYIGQGGRTVTSQNPNLGNRSVGDVQQVHLSGQPSVLVNGQAYASHVTQQQPRTQSTQRTAVDLARQYDFLQNPVFYNHALQQQRQQQAQSLTHQEQQQRLLRQQQTDASTSLRNLLANTYPRTGLDQLSQLHQQHSLQQQTLSSQFGLGQANVPRISTTLQQHGDRIMTSSKPGNTQHTRVIMNEQQHREMTQPNEASVLVNQNTVQGSLRNRQNIPQDLLSRHLSPTQGRSPTGFYPNMGPNIYQNLLLPPNMNNATGIVSPQGAYSPIVGHIPRGPVSRLPMRSEATGNLQNNIGFNKTVNQRSVSRDLQSPQRLPSSGPVVNTHVHVKRQTSSVNSCSAPVIISDSEEDDEEQQEPSTSGTLTTSAKRQIKKDTSSPSKSLRVVIDDDIEIVGMKEAEIMSHMRSDCPIHSFKFFTITLCSNKDNNRRNH